MRDVLVLCRITPDQMVTIGYGSWCTAPFKQISVGNTFQADITFGNRDLIRLWQKDTNQIKVLLPVFAKYAERVMVRAWDIRSSSCSKLLLCIMVPQIRFNFIGEVSSISPQSERW